MKLSHALLSRIRTISTINKAVLLYRKRVEKQKAKWMRIWKTERKEQEELGLETVKKALSPHRGFKKYIPRENTKQGRIREEMQDKKKRRLDRHREIALVDKRPKIPLRIVGHSRRDGITKKNEKKRGEQKILAMLDSNLDNFLKFLFIIKKWRG